MIEVFADIAYGTGSGHRSVQGLAIYVAGRHPRARSAEGTTSRKSPPRRRSGSASRSLSRPRLPRSKSDVAEAAKSAVGEAAEALISLPALREHR